MNRADIAGQRLTIVEDVISSGGAVKDAVNALRERGAIVEQGVCVIDRETGGLENLAGLGLTVQALFRRSDLE